MAQRTDELASLQVCCGAGVAAREPCEARRVRVSATLRCGWRTQALASGANMDIGGVTHMSPVCAPLVTSCPAIDLRLLLFAACVRALVSLQQHGPVSFAICRATRVKSLWRAHVLRLNAGGWGVEDRACGGKQEDLSKLIASMNPPVPQPLLIGVLVIRTG